MRVCWCGYDTGALQTVECLPHSAVLEHLMCTFVFWPAGSQEVRAQAARGGAQLSLEGAWSGTAMDQAPE